MSKHSRQTNPGGGRQDNYTVGYGKPPAHSQFRRGQSGHRAGRHKQAASLEKDVQRVLKTRVEVNAGGRSRKISTQQAVLVKLREKAMQGDPRALDRLLALAGWGKKRETEVNAQLLAAEDQAMLAHHTAEVIEEALAAKQKQPIERVRLNPRKSIPRARLTSSSNSSGGPR
jgi:hypothetical protein